MSRHSLRLSGRFLTSSSENGAVRGSCVGSACWTPGAATAGWRSAPFAAKVDGLIRPEAIAAAKNARQVAVRNTLPAGAAQRLPLPDAAFDVAILSWTLDE
jgi:hypothetical protein